MKLKQAILKSVYLYPTILAVFMLMISGINAFAQDKSDKIKITGTVYDETKQPLAGASVREERTSNGTITDQDGNFTIYVKKGSTIRISFLGLESKVMTANIAGKFDIMLKDNTKELGQVVVTGYGKTTKDRVTGSVGIVTAKDLKGSPTANIDQLLQGKLAGVSVQAVSGRPGESSTIRIRGTRSLTKESADPLWVIDGVPLQRNIPKINNSRLSTGDFNDIFTSGIAGIDPNEIESISVLKDASAAAIYGSQAAAGVIVVTTKRGKAGKMQINYSANMTFVTKPPRSANLMNSQEKLAWEQELWDEFSATGYQQYADGDATAYYPVIGIVGMIRSGKGDFKDWTKSEQDAYITRLGQHTTNWFDEIFRTSISNSHHLSFSGGSDKSTYYVSAGYNRNNGLVKKSNYDRYNVSAKIDMKPNKRVTLGVTTDMAYQISRGASLNVDPFKYAYFANPYEMPYNSDGSYAKDQTYFTLAKYNGSISSQIPSNGYNILREIENTSTEAKNVNVNVNVNLGISILKNLKFEGLGSYSYTSNISENINGQDTYAAWEDRPFEGTTNSSTRTYGSIAQSTAFNQSYSLRGQFHFSQTFANIHNISLLAGSEIRRQYAKNIYSKRYGYDTVTENSSTPVYPSDQKVDYNKLVEFAALMDSYSGQSTDEDAMASFYASLDYVLMNKYVLSYTMRTDGSNRFGSKEQFNPTGSLGLSWNMGEENFMYRLKPVLSSLQLRVSGGYTGKVNAAATPYTIMTYSKNFRKTDETYYRMGYIKNPPNSKLRWERTFDISGSVNAGFFDERMQIEIGGYRSLSKDVISKVYVPYSTGFNDQSYNTSKILNKGVEVTVSGQIVKTKDFKLNVSINAAYNANKLVEYNSPYSSYSTEQEGYPISSLFSGICTGIDPKLGIYTYKLRSDTDRKENNYRKDSNNYRFYIGTSNAPVNGGYSLSFSYKQFSLGVSGNYSIGNKINSKISSPASYSQINATSGQNAPQTSRSDLYINHLNVSKDVVNRWTESNPITDGYPRLVDAYGTKISIDGKFLEDYTTTLSYITNGAFIENISYFKISNIYLNYSFPDAQWMRKARITSFGLTASVSNVCIFSNYSGIDPETPGAVYPQARNFTLGLNIGF